jgi:hypothetical protein
MVEPNSFGAVGFVNNTFQYNPLTQGAVSSIDVSVDKNLTTNPPVGGSNTFRPLIEQDGVFYLAAITGPSTPGYNTISATGLMATDFTDFNFSTGTFGSMHPNFGGDLMLFGLGQISGETGGTGILTATIDYDNLGLSIQGAQSTPDSGETLLLLLLALSALALWPIVTRRARSS